MRRAAGAEVAIVAIILAILLALLVGYRDCVARGPHHEYLRGVVAMRCVEVRP